MDRASATSPEIKSQRPFPLALGGMAALAVGVGIGRFVYTPILPVMAESLELSAAASGLIASANYLGYLAGALMAALPFFQGRARAWLWAALLANGLSLAAMGIWHNLSGFFFLRFLGGVAGAFIFVFASSLVLDRLAAMGRRNYSSLHFAGVGVGIAVSGAGVATVEALGSTWWGLWQAAAILALLGAVLVMTNVPGEAKSQAGHRPRDDRPSRNSSMALFRLILAYGLFGFGYIITATFLIAIIRENPETRAIEPWVWVAFGLVAAPSVAFWNWVSSRIGICRAYALACVVEAIAVMASVLWITNLGALFSAVCVGGTLMGITALGLIAARGLSLGTAQRNLALMTAAFGLGQIIGPSFAGFVFDLTGSFFTPSLAAAIALLIAAALVAQLKVPRA